MHHNRPRAASEVSQIVPLPFRADIEGLRGLAILLVVAFHAGIPGFAGGFVGVDIFFVLSGYLISSLLSREASETGSIRVIAFYARRVRRLLPAFLFMLAGIAAAAFTFYPALEHEPIASSAVFAALYVSNLLFAHQATDYLASAPEENLLLHTWSLSVEEQFYLVWPVLFILAIRMGRRAADEHLVAQFRLVRLCIVIAVVSMALSMWLTEHRQPWAFFWPLTRAWEFAVGGLAAIVPSGQLGALSPRRITAGQRFAPGDALVLTGLSLLVVAMIVIDETTTYPGVAALLPVAGTVLLLRAGASQPPAISLLELPVLRFFGRISYSLYLWHWPVLVVAGAIVGSSLNSTATVIALAVSALLAICSMRYVEEPFRRSAAWSARPGLVLGAAGTVSILAMLAAFGWHIDSKDLAASQRRFAEARDDIPSLYASGCHGDVFETSATGCEFGASDASTTVVLFGDSHAAQWFPAMQRIAKDAGWRLVVLTKSSCPAADVAYTHSGLERRYHECEIWRLNALERIAALRPAIVVTTSSQGYKRGSVTPSEWVTGIDRMLGSLSASSRQVVLLRDTPTPRIDVPQCLARATSGTSRLGEEASCTFDRAQAFRYDTFAEEANLAAMRENVSAIDLTDAICPGPTCPVEVGELVIYRDDNHLSSRFVESIANELETPLLRLAGPDAAAAANFAK